MDVAACVRNGSSFRACWRRAVIFAITLLASGMLPAGSESPLPIRVLTIEGMINPVTARYLERNLRAAAASRSEIVVVRLNTPGGLDSSMRRMTQAILNSRVPVVVYVAPSGARAASAGMFVALAAHVAAMAPGTNIGAAHPVALGSRPDGATMEKATNDAAALARAIAAERGRNADWVEQAVRQSRSLSAREARKQQVIDLIAVDLHALLRQLDGRRVTTTTGKVTLRTGDAPVREAPMTWPERILLGLSDPNIAYLLFTIGTIGLIAELYNPGALFPGITGAICLILAFVAFDSLPVNWGGVLLLALAIGLFVAELQAEGVGVLAVGGVLAFLLGSLMLFAPRSPTMPDVRVNPWLIGVMTTGIAAFFLLALRAAMATRHRPVTTGIEALVGQGGIAETDLAPDALRAGRVRIGTEEWSALAEDETIRAGDPVEVVGVEGVFVKVRRGQGEAPGAHIQRPSARAA